MNPIKGAPSAGGEQDTLPWLYGTENAPEGNFDKLCFNTFAFGGFQEEYKTMGKMLEAMKDPTTGHCLVGEFGASRVRIVELCMDGTITLKLRASKKDKVKSILKNLRKQIVETFEQCGRKNFTEFDIQTVTEYKAEKKLDPKKNGEKTGWEFHEEQLQEVVYTRKTTAGRWSMHLESSKMTKKGETVDDGSAVLRANQAQHKYQAEANKVANFGSLEGAKIAVPQKLTPTKAKQVDDGDEEDEDDAAGDEDDEEDGDSHGSFLESGDEEEDMLNAVGGCWIHFNVSFCCISLIIDGSADCRYKVKQRNPKPYKP
jgi:hypothetical protein